jgi:hypothetical protein
LVAALVECCFYGSNVCGDSECFGRFGFFHWYSIRGNYSDCPVSGLRSRQLLFLFGSNNNQTGDDSESGFLSSLPMKCVCGKWVVYTHRVHVSIIW